MKRALYEAWLAALESGKYAQERGQLSVHGGFCCLGVLCRVAKVSIRNGAIDLPSSFRKLVGMNLEGAPMKDGSSDIPLIILNDNGASFAKIAAIVRRDPLVYIREIED